MTEFVSSQGIRFEGRAPFGFYMHRALDTVAISSLEEDAIRQFFENQDSQPVETPAHHSARPGEVWDLDSTQGVTYRVVAVYDDDVSDEVPIFIQPSTGTWFSLDDPLFTGGERVL